MCVHPFRFCSLKFSIRGLRIPTSEKHSKNANLPANSGSPSKFNINYISPKAGLSVNQFEVWEIKGGFKGQETAHNVRVRRTNHSRVLFQATPFCWDLLQRLRRRLHFVDFPGDHLWSGHAWSPHASLVEPSLPSWEYYLPSRGIRAGRLFKPQLINIVAIVCYFVKTGVLQSINRFKNSRAIKIRQYGVYELVSSAISKQCGRNLSGFFFSRNSRSLSKRYDFPVLVEVLFERYVVLKNACFHFIQLQFFTTSFRPSYNMLTNYSCPQWRNLEGARGQMPPLPLPKILKKGAILLRFPLEFYKEGELFADLSLQIFEVLCIF